MKEVQKKVVQKPFAFHQRSEKDPFPQNVLTRQFQFPLEYTEEDKLFQIYTEGQSDKEYTEFWEFLGFIPGRNELSEKQLQQFLPYLEISLLDQQLEKLSEEQFFNLGKFTAAELGYDQQSNGIRLTGWRVVRHTDRTTSCPYYRFDYYFTAEPEQRQLFSGFSGNTQIWHLNMLW